MTSHIRRFAAAAALTVVLSATPAIAAPSRDGEPGRDRNPIVRVIKQILRRFGVVTPTNLPVGPIPGSTSTPNP